MTRDVLIIGGGPAGSSAAIALRQRGCDVLLLEKDRFPRPKLCGEFISPEVHRLAAELGIADDLRAASPAPIHTARLHLYGEPAIEIPLPEPALGLSRATLDQLLLRRAQALGAEVLEQSRVESIHRQPSGEFTVNYHRAAEEHSVVARALICAAGRWNTFVVGALLAAPLTNGVSTRAAFGLKAHFSPNVAAPGRLDLHFFPGGYCGVTNIEADRANVCALLDKSLLRPGISAGDAAAQILLRQPSLAAQLQHGSRVSDFLFTGPLIFGRSQPVHDGMFMVGDAAAFIDPFCGDGICIAMHSGLLAAQALAPALASSSRNAPAFASALAHYANTYRRAFASQFRWAARLRSVARSPLAARWSLRLAGSNRAMRSSLFQRTRLDSSRA